MQIGVGAHLNGIAWSSEFRTVVQRLVPLNFGLIHLISLREYLKWRSLLTWLGLSLHCFHKSACCPVRFLSGSPTHPTVWLSCESGTCLVRFPNQLFEHLCLSENLSACCRNVQLAACVLAVLNWECLSSTFHKETLCNFTTFDRSAEVKLTTPPPPLAEH